MSPRWTPLSGWTQCLAVSDAFLSISCCQTTDCYDISRYKTLTTAFHIANVKRFSNSFLLNSRYEIEQQNIIQTQELQNIVTCGNLFNPQWLWEQMFKMCVYETKLAYKKIFDHYRLIILLFQPKCQISRFFKQFNVKVGYSLIPPVILNKATFAAVHITETKQQLKCLNFRLKNCSTMCYVLTYLF